MPNSAEGNIMRSIIKQIPGALKTAIPLIIFVILYMVIFFALENRTPSTWHVIHTSIDDRIPFIPAFIYPYYSWFALVPTVVVYLLFRDRRTYHETVALLMAGMTVFLLISWLYPNMLSLRPATVEDTFTGHLVSRLYLTDTPTNVLPSMHVYNTIIVLIGVYRSTGKLARNKYVRFLLTVQSVLIICSTVFLKQHSVVDVLTAMGLCVVFISLEEIVLRSFGYRVEEVRDAKARSFD